MSFLIHFLSQILTWLMGFVTWALLQVLSLLLAGLSIVLNAIPVPDWMAGASAAVSNLPQMFIYLVSPLNLGAGVTIVCSAYGLRFLIRRIPIIG